MFIFFALLLTALLLMVEGINFRMYADETITVYYALKFGRLNYEHYIGFHTPILFLFYGLYFLFGLLLGSLNSPADFLATYFSYSPSIFIYGRFVECLAGTAGVWVTYRLGKELFNRRIGLMAALFLTFSYVQVNISQLARGQAFSALFFLAAFYFIARIARSPKLKNYLLAGLFTGMALSIRINILPIFLPLLLAHYFRGRQEGKPIFRALLGGKIFPAFFLAAAAYLVSRPDISQDIAMYISLARTYAEPTANYVGSQPQANSFLYYLGDGFPAAFGWTLSLVFLGGVIYALTRIKKLPNRLLLSFIFPYLLLMGMSSVVSWRYLFPLAPLGGILAARLVFQAVGGLTAGRRRDYLLVIVSLLLIIEGGSIIRRKNRLQTLPRTQNISQQWIFENIPHGARVAADSMGEQGPDLKRVPVIDYEFFNLSPEELQELCGERLAGDPGGSMALRYFMENPPYPKYRIYNLGMRELVDLPLLRGDEVEYVVISSSVRATYDLDYVREGFPEMSQARMELYRWLEDEGELVKSFSPDRDSYGPRIDIYRMRYPLSGE